MADERNMVAPDASTQLAPSGQSVNAGSSTTNTDLQAKLSQLESRVQSAEGRADAAEKEAKLASKKADRVREQVYGRVAKRMEEKESALRDLAQEEGWEESTLNDKIAKARLNVLTSLKSEDLKALDTEDTPAPQPQYPTQLPAQPSPYQGNAAQPLLNVDALTQHAQGLKQYLASLGVSESDLGPQGILPYVGKPEGSEEQFEFMEKALAARKKNQELVKQLAQRQQREADAQEVKEELDEYGNLGGTGAGNGGGSPANNLTKLKQEIMKKYRGTGDMAAAMQEIAQLEARMG